MAGPGRKGLKSHLMLKTCTAGQEMRKRPEWVTNTCFLSINHHGIIDELCIFTGYENL